MKHIQNVHVDKRVDRERKPRFDREWREMIELLPESRREVMYAAVREYQLYGTEPSGLDGAEMMAFMLIRKIVDRRKKRRDARKNKPRVNQSAPVERQEAADSKAVDKNRCSEAEKPQSIRYDNKKNCGNPLGGILKAREKYLAGKERVNRGKRPI